MFEWFVLHQCRRFFAVFVECEHSMIQPFYCLVRLTTGLNLKTTLGSAVCVSGTFKGRQKQTLYEGLGFLVKIYGKMWRKWRRIELYCEI